MDQKARRWVVACWLQVAVATLHVLFSFYSHFTRPTMQLDFSRATGLVREVTPGGAAAQAGIRPGDRIVSISDQPVRRGGSPLFATRPGDGVPVHFERAGVPSRTIVLPVTAEEARRQALQAGGGHTLSAITAYIFFPLHLWILGLGILLLALRGDNADARLAALTLAYWAGGSFFFEAAGMGVLLEPVPVGARVLLYCIDALFIAGFFGACLHFALRFPRARGEKSSWLLDAGPYILAAPMFLEAAWSGIRRAATPPAPIAAVSTAMYLTLGPALLIAALVTLAWRFRSVTDLNSRRRLQLIFLSLLPGAAGFTFSAAINAFDAGLFWTQVGRMANLVGTMISSGIFAYAVVRRRIFNVRFLVRRSIQHALARGTLLALMSLPVIGLLGFLYSNRGESLAALLTKTPATYLMLIVPLLLVVRYRRPLLDWLDRKYFKEEYDSRRVLLQVVSMIRDGSDVVGLSRVALDEIERALHPKHMSIWHLSPDDATFQRGMYSGTGVAEAPPLPASSALATLLSTDSDPLDLYSRQTRGLVRRLPLEERLWLGQNVAYLLVPLILDQRLVGILLLGERLSEEPYGREDRELLRTLAAHLAFTLDYSRLKASPALVWSPPASSSVQQLVEPVKLCPSCGRCYDASQTHCELDNRPLVSEEGVPRLIDEKYIIERLLGRGGMGSVYLANQTRLNRPVAVKVLLTHLVGSSSMRSRFEREARIVARLRHPSIVTIHDFGVLPTGHAYLIMEYLEGPTLRKTILSSTRTLDESLEVIRQVGEAIHAAHRAGVIHRDLKPENIMMVRDHDGRPSPRVLDFGLAKMSGPAADDEATLVQSGHSAGIVGTLMYMAPEALSGRTVDAKSDQYSLGLIAYELISGMHPFGTATDLASVVKGHTDQPPPPLHGVPGKISAAVQRALAKGPAERFPTVGDFVDALTS